MTVLLWEVTGELPMKLVKKPKFGTWTLTRNQLPEYNEPVLALDDLGMMNVIQRYGDDDEGFSHGICGGIKVIKWMPLPSR